MKRARDDSLSLCHLLSLDLVVEIMHHDWTNSGPWAFTCRYNLWCMTRPEVLTVLLKWAKEERKPLKWLRFSLPHHWIMNQEACAYIQRLKPKFDAILSERPLSTHNDCCLTGGLVARLLYGRQWRSDIDVWISQWVEEESDQKRRQIEQHFDNGANKDWDFVWCWRTEPQHMFEEFDLSIVQQGYCANDSQFYLTSLALHSYQSREIIIAPTSLTVGYMGHCQATPYNVNPHYASPFDIVERLFESHKNGNHKKSLHQCQQCRQSRLEHPHLIEWLDRLAKYEKRFPDFTHSYLM